MRGLNICFHFEVRKIVFELSSVPLIIWSSGKLLVFCRGKRVEYIVVVVVVLLFYVHGIHHVGMVS